MWEIWLTIGRSINTTIGMNILEGQDKITPYRSELFDLFKMRWYLDLPPVSLRKLNQEKNSLISTNGKGLSGI